MCSAILLLGDTGTDHDGFHSSPVIAASPDVFLDGKPVARQGDQLAPHDKPIAVTSTAIGCGGVVIDSGSGQAG
ncbi:PAAR domain-containing protein [Aeromonas salmonicida]